MISKFHRLIVPPPYTKAEVMDVAEADWQKDLALTSTLTVSESGNAAVGGEGDATSGGGGNEGGGGGGGDDEGVGVGGVDGGADGTLPPSGAPTALDYDVFWRAMFQLVDTWTETVEKTE